MFRVFPVTHRTALKVIIAALSLVASQGYAFDAPAPPQAATGTLQALFSPWDNIEGAILSALAGAKQQVFVQAYLLTNGKIASALLSAKGRGVDVQVLMDGKQIKSGGYAKAAVLATAGIPVWLETKYQNAHNKIIVIDPSTTDPVLITGSFNFTWAAQHSNAENVLIVRKNPQLTARYALNWQRHRQDAVRYDASKDNNPKNSAK
ncbi:phospholipase D family nuclease [Glaciimonas soli]|uniref:phospholipase D n=1 Tax=Glaciimonas soli TaxID=2590999 RepID=A0A843YSC6_9BURK|nr:phospholipase D family protein [Glaciimonas soli]MQR02030.1 phospholipase D family protein [Glaciimonas soli]